MTNEIKNCESCQFFIKKKGNKYGKCLRPIVAIFELIEGTYKINSGETLLASLSPPFENYGIDKCPFYQNKKENLKIITGKNKKFNYHILRFLNRDTIFIKISFEEKYEDDILRMVKSFLELIKKEYGGNKNA